MASTYSPLLRIELIGTGDQPGTWGDTTNTNLGDIIEDAIAGTATINVTVGNVTLTELNGSPDQSRCAALLVTGTPGTTRSIIAPASSKIYVISNTSDSGVTIKTLSSTGFTVPTGVTMFVYYNGTDFVSASQPYDADLKAIADLVTTGIIVRTGSGTATTRTITASTGITVTNGDGVAGNPTVAVSVVPVANGGTNITSYAVGDIIYASGSTTLSKLADVATGNALISGGVNTAPSWGKVTLTGHVSGTLPVANGGTGVTTSTGSGNVVLSTSPTLSSPTLVTPVLGTPSSGTLTNCTGLPVATGIANLGTNVATFLTTPSSANLAAAVTDETGSGSLVFATSPTLVTPALGTPTSGNLANCTNLPIDGGTSGTLPVSRGGTGTTSLSGVAYGNGTSGFTAASAAQIVAAIGSTYVSNASYATNAGTATNVSGGGSVSASSGSFSSLSTGGLNLNILGQYLISSDGYQKLPSGIIIQWGIGPTLGVEGNAVVTLPITFPNAHLIAFGSVYRYGAVGGVNSAYAQPLSTSTVGVSMDTSNGGVSAPVAWLSIGY